jgi:ABC-type uncharacterized transport system substrate-binding protein
MQRRDFIKIIAGSAPAVWPLYARAEPPPMPVIGFLRPTSPADSTNLLTAWRDGLKEAGFVEGHNLTVEYRWAENKMDRLPELAADLVRRQVSIIVAAGNASAHVAKAATRSIPIVFVVGEDPIATGLVAHLNRPGANITGITFETAVVTTKKLQLLSELIGKPGTIAFLTNPNNPQTELQLNQAQAAAQSLGEQILSVQATSGAGIEAAFAAAVEHHVEGLLVAGDAFFFSKRYQLVALATRNAIPAAYQWRNAVTAGGLMSYGPSLPNAYKQAGVYVGRILKGDKPADLPIMQPTKYEFVINLKTARMLGISVSSTMQLLADEVIE